MSKTVIIAALPGELKFLVRGWQHESRNGVELWRRSSGKSEWIAACAGAGVDAATQAFAEAEKGGPADRIISTGWAGALRPELASGQAYRVSGVIDALTGERFTATGSADDCWLVTSGAVAGQAEKRRLAAAYPAAMVDMEAAGVARLAAMRGALFYCIKGISDGYSDQLPDFNRFISPEGQFQLIRFIIFALFRPWCWPALIRMGENSNKAARAIAQSMLVLLDEQD